MLSRTYWLIRLALGSHVLELENRIKWLEGIIRENCPDVDLCGGPPAELRSRPTPPAIRIVTTGPDMHPPQSSMSSTSSPVFALSPASTCATPASFEFSPGVSPGYLAPFSPYTFSDGGSPSPSPGPSSPLIHSPLMLPQDPISQEVGLLSLSAIEEPKYIGSSSGISFIRLVLQDGQEPDFRPVEYQSRDAKPSFGGSVRHWPGINAEPALLPNLEECGVLAGIYFTTVSLQYPFLNRPQFEACLETVHQADNGAAYQLPQGYTLAVARFQVFLVLSISANILSSRMGHHMDSEGYFATAMRCVDDITLTGSVQAAQSALLLAMRSLYATGGLNLWYLNAIIMATCVDLGLQRKIISFGQNQSAMKRRVFWCAYVLDRNLGISLGRPFSLRDEAFDVEFPDEGDNDEELTHPNAFSIGGGPSPNVVTAHASFSGSIYLFRMTKILSNIKITLHRVVQPSVGKWQVDLSDWQAGIHRQLTELRDQARSALGASRRSSGTGGTRLGNGQMVELKFYEAIQLLFRPSPAFPRPNSFEFQQCFTAAIETIRIYAKLKRYGELQYTWLTAHSIYLSGITMLHAYTNCREIQTQATSEVLLEDIRSCSSLLESLGARWPIAKLSKAKFDTQAHSIILLVTSNSSRMLSPNDGPRRASSSSQGRHFSEFQKLEVPSMSHHATQQTQPQLGSTPSNWYTDPTAGTSSNSGADVLMDTSWMGAINWGAQTDLLVSNGGTGFEGMDPNDDNILSFLSAPVPEVGTCGDTSMWGMEQGEHDTGL